jgi:hypothetical protein
MEGVGTLSSVSEERELHPPEISPRSAAKRAKRKS